MLIGVSKRTREGGYAYTKDAEGRIREEMSTVTCVHTNSVIHVPPGKKFDEVSGWCVICDGPIRLSEVGKPCDVFEKKLERAESRQRFRQSLEG